MDGWEEARMKAGRRGKEAVGGAGEREEKWKCER